ncbi:MAG: hypothetical protein WDN28_02850 [Chthoniobacter sp.]
MKFVRSLLVLLTAVALSGCIFLPEPPPTTPSGTEAGPRPTNPRAVIADWANSHYKYMVSSPFTPEEMAISEPTPIVYHDALLGRKIGWEVIIGPDTPRLSRVIEMDYTRFILYRDGIISMVSSDRPFPEVRGPVR